MILPRSDERSLPPVKQALDAMILTCATVASNAAKCMPVFTKAIKGFYDYYKYVLTV
jgi:hypothetical protein